VPFWLIFCHAFCKAIAHAAHCFWAVGIVEKESIVKAQNQRAARTHKGKKTRQKIIP